MKGFVEEWKKAIVADPYWQFEELLEEDPDLAEAIRTTVKKRWEHNPEDSPEYDLTDTNLIRNCVICDFGGSGNPVMDSIARMLDEGGELQETVRKLSGESLKRACFRGIK